MGGCLFGSSKVASSPDGGIKVQGMLVGTAPRGC